MIIVQVLESYETDSGESVVVVNVGGGETITIEGEIVETSTPLAPVVIEGEVTVAQVSASEECSNGESYVVIATGGGEYEAVEAQVIAAPVTEIPTEVIATPEQVPEAITSEVHAEVNEVVITSTTVGGEEYIAVVPNAETFVEGAPIVIIETSEDSYVVQVIESYESNGESYVVANMGGETVTLEAEIVETSSPIAAIVTEGEVVVTEVATTEACNNGENYVVVPTGEGEYEAVSGNFLG